jgi:hypothetical protein
MVNPYKFYTYAYLREDRTPYYVGKGKGNRAYKKGKSEIGKPKDKSKIIFLKQNLTEQEAFKHEIYMIAVFGRKDLGTGILRNQTDGGEGISGNITKPHSEETKRKIGEANKGRTHSEEIKRKIGESKTGEKNHNYGKSFSEEYRKKLSEAHKGENHPNYGKPLPKETRRKISEANKNPSEETRRKMSEAKKGRTHSDETKRKLSEMRKGTKWWNDGQMNKRVIECPGDGWVRGKL